MFEGLDAIAWGQLEHAYGTAEDVPAQIRALASGDQEAIIEALYALSCNIYHQGTVFTASAPAVPFLVEALGVLQGEAQSLALVLLGEMAQGHGYYDVHRVFGDVPDTAGTPEADSNVTLSATLATERATVRDTTLAVFAQWDAIEKLLSCPTLPTRIAALYVLSKLAQNDASDPADDDVPARYLGVSPEGAPQHSYAARLSQLADERLIATADPFERAAWLRALLQMGGFEHPALQPGAAQDRSLLEKYFAAVACGARQIGATPVLPEELTVLLGEIAEHHAEISSTLEDSGWPWGGSPNEQILWLLTQLPDPALDRIAPACANLVAATRALDFGHKPLLELVLGETQPQIPDGPCTLSPGRRQIAHALLTDPGADEELWFWDPINGTAAAACQSAGVPHDRELWLQWLG